MKGRFDFLILHLLGKEEMYGFRSLKDLLKTAPRMSLNSKTGTFISLAGGNGG